MGSIVTVDLPLGRRVGRFGRTTARRPSRTWRPRISNRSITEHWMAGCSSWSTDRREETSHGPESERCRTLRLGGVLGRQSGAQ